MSVLVDRLGQAMAERLDRRSLLTRAAQATFAGTAASVAAVMLPKTVLAGQVCPWRHNNNLYDCTPTNSTYCPNCNLANCPGDCSVDTSAWGASGCWCTLHTNLGGQGGSYSCCDCKGGSNCAVACTCKSWWPSGKPLHS
jgi:hypothetical protein